MSSAAISPLKCSRMMAELRCAAFWGFLTVLRSLSSGAVPDAEVFCVFNESCILPCSFQASDEPVILWTHEDSPVHSHYDGKDRLQNQNQNFRGRTSLFGEQISSGNASLLLTGVKVQDQGRYRCNASSRGGTELQLIDVKVDAPVKTVHLQHEDTRITCSSEGIYPEPDLSWSTDHPFELFLRSSTIVQRTEQQLFNISSSVVAPDNGTNVMFSCTVGTRRRNRTASLATQKNTDAAKGMGIVAAVIVVAMLMSLVPCFAERFRKFWESQPCCQEEISLPRQDEAVWEPIKDTGDTNEMPV